MRVAVTGATGFVGSHTVAALLTAGHDVRLLARAADRVPAAFDPLGIETPSDILLGDVTDPATVEQLLEGCEAVVHAASIYSLDTRDTARIRATNVAGTRLIIETGRRLGLDPIVHVSSVVAIAPASQPLHPDAPVARSQGVYSRSKSESEALAREHQAEGAPVVTVMPGSIWGPHDPHFGESCRIVSNFLRGLLRIYPSGGQIGIVDVRDVAATLVGAIEPGRGPRRYYLAPHHLPTREVLESINRLTGREAHFITLPNPIIAALIAPVGPLQRILPFRLPIPVEAVRLSMSWPPGDSSAAAADFGITWRQLDETIADTIGSMVEHDQLNRKLAGSLESWSSS